MLPKKGKKRFQQLIRKYLEGKASSEEEAFVESYYQQFDGKALDSSLDGEEQQAAEDRLLERLEQRIDLEHRIDRPAQGTVIPFYRHRLLRPVAAAAILLLIAGSYWYFKGTTNSPQTGRQSIADIAPGGDKATLTLANGQSVILDSTSNGREVQQGHSTIVQLAAGQIDYASSPRSKNRTEEGTTLYNTLATPIGGQYKMTLPDGTRVWLNSASSIHYPTAFTGSERRVELKGEAYFRVSKDAHTPFMVEALGTTIQVLGTHFNVMAYSDEATVNTTLLEGKVRVVSGKDNAVLQPGEQAVAGAAFTVKKVDTEREIAWTTGYFEFDQTDLPTLMRQLKRWYGIEPVYQNNGTGRLFGGRINRNLKLSEVLHLLEGNGIHFSIEGKRLIVLP